MDPETCPACGGEKLSFDAACGVLAKCLECGYVITPKDEKKC